MSPLVFLGAIWLLSRATSDSDDERFQKVTAKSGITYKVRIDENIKVPAGFAPLKVIRVDRGALTILRYVASGGGTTALSNPDTVRTLKDSPLPPNDPMFKAAMIDFGVVLPGRS